MKSDFFQSAFTKYHSLLNVLMAACILPSFTFINFQIRVSCVSSLLDCKSPEDKGCVCPICL